MLTPCNQMPLLAEHHRCESNEWQCANKRCIPEAWRCDSENDCGDNSDEDVYNCASRICQPGYFKCANNHCIPQGWKCDVDNDCGDYSDEPMSECSKFLWEDRACPGAGNQEAPASAPWHAPCWLSLLTLALQSKAWLAG